jgi:hypothetical protein
MGLRKYNVSALSIAGASQFARKWVGDHPTIDSTYATSGDGMGKIEVAGANLKELFPAKR